MNRICLICGILATFFLLMAEEAMAQGYGGYSTQSYTGKNMGVPSTKRTQSVFEFPYYGDTQITVAGFRLSEQFEDGLQHQGYAGEISFGFYPNINPKQKRDDPHPLSVAFFLKVLLLPPRSDPGVQDLISVRSEYQVGMNLFIVNTPEWLFSVGPQFTVERKDPYDDNPKWGIEVVSFHACADLGYSGKNISLHLRGEYFLGILLNDRKREGFFSQLSFGWHPDPQVDFYLRVSREKDSSRSFSLRVYQFVRTIHKFELDLVMHATKNVAFSLSGHFQFESRENQSNRSLEGWMIRFGVIIAIN